MPLLVPVGMNSVLPSAAHRPAPRRGPAGVSAQPRSIQVAANRRRGHATASEEDGEREREREWEVGREGGREREREGERGR